MELWQRKNENSREIIRKRSRNIEIVEKNALKNEITLNYNCCMANRGTSIRRASPAPPPAPPTSIDRHQTDLIIEKAKKIPKIVSSSSGVLTQRLNV